MGTDDLDFCIRCGKERLIGSDGLCSECRWEEEKEEEEG